ncbi:hypothetical protein G9C98_003554, partial [Cotesia typhae]
MKSLGKFWDITELNEGPLCRIYFILGERPKIVKVNECVLPGPIVVHGSKSIGRTCTFCAIDSCLYQLVGTATISVSSVVLKIRQQRNFNIPSVRQYIFIHMLLHYYLKK